VKDYFSRQSEHYARYRPGYPPPLFDHIMGFVEEKKLAWDCGTGNGQAAVAIARYFEKVYATDISINQVSNAVKKSNIDYAIEPAESTSLQTNSVDLITISQALHWFDFDKFYAEARRVGTQKAVIAAWTYPLMKIDPDIDAIIDDFYSGMLHGYWDKERRYVDEEYSTIPFPFTQLPSGNFKIEVEWSLEDIEGYLNTWSALQKYITINNENPVALIINKLKNYWPDNGLKKVIFPVYLKIGRVH